MRDSNSAWLAPPAAFAARIAMSAWPIRVDSAPCSGYIASPIEQVIDTSRPATEIGRPIDASTPQASSEASSTRGSLVSSSKNSSPARRAAMCGRTKVRNRFATSRSTWSPPLWPND